jgi:hypothetical protein
MTTKHYTIKFMGKRAYAKIFDSLACIADMSFFNTDENWEV